MVARSDTPPEPFHWAGCHDQTQQRSCRQVIYVRRRYPCSQSPLSLLSCRIKEELGGSERCQEAVTIGWQRFKQLTGQFSSGHIDSSCYLSSFLNLFPNDPHRRHTEVKRPSAHFDDYTLCCICGSSSVHLSPALHLCHCGGGAGAHVPDGGVCVRGWGAKWRVMIYARARGAPRKKKVRTSRFPHCHCS